MSEFQLFSFFLSFFLCAITLFTRRLPGELMHVVVPVYPWWCQPFLQSFLDAVHRLYRCPHILAGLYHQSAYRRIAHASFCLCVYLYVHVSVCVCMWEQLTGQGGVLPFCAISSSIFNIGMAHMVVKSIPSSFAISKYDTLPSKSSCLTANQQHNVMVLLLLILFYFVNYYYYFPLAGYCWRKFILKNNISVHQTRFFKKFYY